MADEQKKVTDRVGEVADKQKKDMLAEEHKRHTIPIRNVINGEIVAYASTNLMKDILETLLWEKLKAIRVDREIKEAAKLPADPSRLN